jgi:hypothetical protein
MHSLWCTIHILWCYNKFDILLSEYPDKSETQDELELQRYLLDESDLEKSPLNQISTIISYCKTCVSSTATSVPLEKIFSSGGLIVTKLWNKLSSEVVDQIIFLNKNKIKVPRNEPHITD